MSNYGELDLIHYLDRDLTLTPTPTSSSQIENATKVQISICQTILLHNPVLYNPCLTFSDRRASKFQIGG